MKWTFREIYEQGCNGEYNEYKWLVGLINRKKSGYEAQLAAIDNKIKNLNTRINELEAYLK